MTLSMLQINEKSKKMLSNLKMNNFFNHMENNKEDNRILALSYMLHEKQKDKAGVDYIIHLMHVGDIAIGIKGQMGCSHLSDTTIVQGCLLHDSKEDKEPEDVRRKLGVTQEQLYLEYDIHEEAKIAVDDVSRLDGETYFGFIDRIIESSKANPLSKLVKVADLLSNSNDIRCQEMPLNEGLSKRYDKALKKLGHPVGFRKKHDLQFSPM